MDYLFTVNSGRRGDCTGTLRLLTLVKTLKKIMETDDCLVNYGGEKIIISIQNREKT